MSWLLLSEDNCKVAILLGVEDEAGEVNCDIRLITRHKRLLDSESSQQERPTLAVLDGEASEPNDVLRDLEWSALGTSTVFLGKIAACELHGAE